jgi:hypothetical protein
LVWSFSSPYDWIKHKVVVSTRWNINVQVSGVKSVHIVNWIQS